MPEAMDVKSAISNLTDEYGRLSAELKKLPDMEAKLADLTKSFDLQMEGLRKAAERKSLLNETITGDDVADRRLALGALIKGMVARKFEQLGTPDSQKGKFDRKNEMSMKQYGYTGRDRELSEHMLEKAASFQLGSLDTAGGVFVDHEVMGAEWIKKLRPNEKTIFDAGAQWSELPAGAGVLSWPRQTSLASVGNVSETGQLITTTVGWEQITATPKRVGATGMLSKRLLFSAEFYAKLFEDEVGYSLMRQVQNAALYGTGSSGAPRGVFYDPGVTKVYLANGGSTTAGAAGKIGAYTDVNLMEDLIAEQNGRIGGFSIIAQPQVIRNLKNSIINSNGTFNLFPEGTLASDANLKAALGGDRNFFRLTDLRSGQTVGSSTDCTDTFFGQFDNIIIPTWGGVQIKVSDVATVQGTSAFETHSLALAADLEYDVVIRQPKELFVALDLRAALATGI